HPSSEGRVGLWAHQSVLMQTVSIAFLYRLPNSADNSPSLRQYFETSARVPEFSVVAHCALLHFLYRGQVPDQVNMFGFIITPLPVWQCPWNSAMVEVMTNPVQPTPWIDVMHLAERYNLMALA
ncbi:hypothetical protein BGZ74_001160, partial [Mortierella antarctica]